MEFLLHLDEMLLLGLNGLAGDGVLDSLALFLSAKWAWLPLYGFIIYALAGQFGWKRTGWICLAAACMVVLTDQGSVQLFKETFQRLRPCHLPELKNMMTLVSGRCGSQFGFISSHSANVFGCAVFVSFLFSSVSRWWNLIFAWAFLVSMSRVYLGVHYPSDVLAGAIYGAFIGYLSAKFTLNVIRTV